MTMHSLTTESLSAAIGEFQENVHRDKKCAAIFRCMATFFESDLDCESMDLASMNPFHEEFSMKIMSPITAIAAPLLAAIFTSANAVPRADLLGDPAPDSAAERTIALGANTRHVNVTEGDTVRFVAGDKAFTWKFQVAKGISSFDLNSVAPQGLLQNEVRAYVAPKPRFNGAGPR
ncbi:CzcE family metal-binding protein [Herbaspirillum sp. ST 5-3]|uniref:CzcE family metal-binding protein n=1 Tax=Oxalobacteraceae TaxID=75682 RepID=UPI001FFF3D51|nr:CzcE family metal-binding protein [Herbaspirillum sp. ST 5-3]